MQFRIIFLLLICSSPVFAQFKIKNVEYEFSINKDRSLFVKGSVLYSIKQESFSFYQEVPEKYLTFDIPIPARFRPYGLTEDEASIFRYPPPYFKKINLRVNGQKIGDKLLIENDVCKIDFSRDTKPLTGSTDLYHIDYNYLIENYFVENTHFEFGVLEFGNINNIDQERKDSLNISFKVFNHVKKYPQIKFEYASFNYYGIKNDTLFASCKIDSNNNYIITNNPRLTGSTPKNYFIEIPLKQRFWAEYFFYFIPLGFFIIVLIFNKLTNNKSAKEFKNIQNLHYFTYKYANNGNLSFSCLLGLFYKWGDAGYIKITKLDEQTQRWSETIHNWQIEIINPAFYSSLHIFEREFAYFIFNNGTKTTLFEIPLYELDHNKQISIFINNHLVDSFKRIKLRLYVYGKRLFFILCSWFLLKHAAIGAFFLLIATYIYSIFRNRSITYSEPFATELKILNTHIESIESKFKFSNDLPMWLLYYFSYDYFIIKRISKEINYQPTWCKDYETAARFLYELDYNNRFLYREKYPDRD